MNSLKSNSAKSISGQSDGAKVSQVIPDIQSTATLSNLDKEVILKRLITNSIYMGGNCEITKSILEKKTLIGFVNVENRHNYESL
jgi:hypothetical protein